MRVIIGNAWSINMLQGDARVSFRQLTLEEVRELLLQTDDLMSIVGHEGTADVFSRILERVVPVNRIQYKLGAEDVLLVGSIGTRLPEGRILTAEELQGLPLQWWSVRLIG